jgi:hypothetical protein
MSKVCRLLSFISVTVICCSIGCSLSSFTLKKIIQDKKWANNVSLIADDIDDTEHKSYISFQAIEVRPEVLSSIFYLIVFDQVISTSSYRVSYLFIFHCMLRI